MLVLIRGNAVQALELIRLSCGTTFRANVTGNKLFVAVVYIMFLQRFRNIQNAWRGWRAVIDSQLDSHE